MPKSRLPRVLLLFNNPVLPADHPDAASERDVVETVDEVEKVLPPDQFRVVRMGYARDVRVLIRKLKGWKPDVVFNLFEGEADRTETEIHNAAVLEWSGIPFTGSAPGTLALGRDKVRTKYLLQGAGLPTAPFRVYDTPAAGDWPHPWPAIVKPAYQDASVGIDQASVVGTPAELRARVQHVFDRFGGPVLAEQFIDGREFHVNLFEDAAGDLILVPPTELTFGAGKGYWPIYSYVGKWDVESVEYKTTGLATGLVLTGPLGDRMAEVCKAGYRLLGMRDYGRVDVRVTPDGTPWVLEVNPNPHLNSLVLVDGLKVLDRPFGAFIQGLVRRALGRGPQSPR